MDIADNFDYLSSDNSEDGCFEFSENEVSFNDETVNNNFLENLNSETAHLLITYHLSLNEINEEIKSTVEGVLAEKAPTQFNMENLKHRKNVILEKFDSISRDIDDTTTCDPQGNLVKAEDCQLISSILKDTKQNIELLEEITKTAESRFPDTNKQERSMADFKRSEQLSARVFELIEAYQHKKTVN